MQICRKAVPAMEGAIVLSGSLPAAPRTAGLLCRFHQLPTSGRRKDTGRAVTARQTARTDADRHAQPLRKASGRPRARAGRQPGRPPLAAGPCAPPSLPPRPRPSPRGGRGEALGPGQPPRERGRPRGPPPCPWQRRGRPAGGAPAVPVTWPATGGPRRPRSSRQGASEPLTLREPPP